MAGYWGANYWHANYWHATYWTPTGGVGTAGDYWHENYWHASYWANGYWAKINTGDVNQFNTPNLVLTGINPTVNIELDVGVTTATLALTSFNADANLDIDPAVTTATLPLTAFDASIGLEGYQLGDIDLRLVPDSVQQVTYGVVTSLPTITFGPMTHTIEEGGGINVAADVASLGFTSFVTDSRLDIDVEPLPASLALTGFNTTAGIGAQIPATLAALNFATSTHTIVATNAQVDVNPQTASMPIIWFSAEVAAVVPDVKPEFGFDYSGLIVNSDAIEYPSNYEICERTGFRVIRGGLKKEWNGTMVRPESWEARHPQDLLRSRPERERHGAKRPEQTDRFIEERITADSL